MIHEKVTLRTKETDLLVPKCMKCNSYHRTIYDLNCYREIVFFGCECCDHVGWFRITKEVYKELIKRLSEEKKKEIECQ